jgi:hypothetical protein
MWSLDEFRFDEGIEAAEVLVFDRADGSELMGRDEAIALAHERGANLVAWWPPAADQVPSCIVAKVSLPPGGPRRAGFVVRAVGMAAGERVRRAVASCCRTPPPTAATSTRTRLPADG